ncbi:MAG TPA: ABC transporter permease [Candidatus Dormibacteraeota bacterium]|nr:ABC transporter permease [Candidatus Dormibacteraeota bacterium]
MPEEKSIATRFYRALLRLLPFEFRGDFGPEMEQVFSRQHQEAIRGGRLAGLARLWCETIAGIFRTAPREHLAMFAQDAGFSLRMMRKNYGFTVAAIFTLALGIGANSAIFSVVNAVLVRPLPYENGDRIVLVQQQSPRAGFPNQSFSPQEFFEYRAQNHALDEAVEYHAMNFILLGRSEPERVDTGVVSWNFFAVFGIKPLLGRGFRPEDETPGAPAVLLLTNEYWLRSFGGDPTVVGKNFSMNDRVHTVIGVLPPVPQYPDENSVYMPTSACPFRSNPQNIANRRYRLLRVFGRLRPGVDARQAQADLRRVASNLQHEHPDVYPANSGYTARVTLLRDELTKNARTTMLVLLAAAGFVLLIASANVANLNLSRMVRRERELAIRSALGAGRARLFRQLLTESFLMALIGGALGLLFARGGLGMLVTFAARFTPRAREIQLDGSVLLFTLAIAVLTSLSSGCLPALAARENVVGHLKEGGSQSTVAAGKQRLRNLLIVVQVAVSFLLLIGAGLMLHSFMILQHVDPGFQPDNVLTMRIGLNFTKYDTPDKTRAFFENLLEKIQAQSGVRSAAASLLIPLNAAGPARTTFQLEGQTPGEGQALPLSDVRVVSPTYFDTLHIPLLQGRTFAMTDRADSPDVVILNRAAARRFWETQNPIGKRISTDNGHTWNQVVGIVGDVKQYGLDKDATEEIYFPMAKVPLGQANLVIKTAGEPMSMARTVIGLIYDIDPNQPAVRVRSLEEVRADSIAAPRLTANLLGLFALLALAIAAAGIGGVMALAVSQRTHEIGMRMAIGARPADILRMVLGQGMSLALIGVAMGLLAALELTRVLRGLLFEVTPTDPLTFAGVAAVLVTAAFVATYFPARRAAHVDPMVALRVE